MLYICAIKFDVMKNLELFLIFGLTKALFSSPQKLKTF